MIYQMDYLIYHVSKRKSYIAFRPEYKNICLKRLQEILS